MKRKNLIKISAVAAAAALVCSTAIPVYAESDEENTEKEEVVYVNLNGDGSVKGIYVVNIFDLKSDNQIIDYGNYESLRNMTTNDEINYSDNTVKIDAEKGKLYYEGKLSSDVMPWNISIRYFIDDQEYSSDEIAGKSGNLKIEITINENTDCTSDFFNNYALQASLTFDTGKCKNISSDGATTANVGSDKQLTYTVLPGKGANYTITADVEEFEMSAVSVNGVPISLSIDVDDEDLTEKITALIDAVSQLDDGAGELNNGIDELQSGVENDLQSGVSELQDGGEQINDGAAELKNGGESLKNGTSSLKSATVSLDSGVNSLNDGIKQISDGLNLLNEKSSSLTDGSEAFGSALSQIQSALNNVDFSTDNLSKLTGASSEIKKGIDTLADSASVLQQSVSFEAYKNTMKSNGLDIGILQQNNAAVIQTLQNNLNELNAQISELKAQGADTSQFDGQLQQIADLITLLTANNAAIDGANAYLTAVNENMEMFVEGIRTLQTNYAEFDESINGLADTLGGLVYDLSILSDAIDTLVTEYSKIDDGIGEYTDAVARIVAGYSQLTVGAENLVSGSGQLKNGASTLDSGAFELLSGITELYEGTDSFKDGTNELYSGVSELLDGISEIKSGSEEMKDGTSQMRDETTGMDKKVSDKIDELTESISGSNYEIQSFVSEKNTNVDSVQFVIKTEEIKFDYEQPEETVWEENKGFWQKLLSLFGIEK